MAESTTFYYSQRENPLYKPHVVAGRFWCLASVSPICAASTIPVHPIHADRGGDPGLTAHVPRECLLIVIVAGVERAAKLLFGTISDAGRLLPEPPAYGPCAWGLSCIWSVAFSEFDRAGAQFRSPPLSPICDLHSH